MAGVVAATAVVASEGVAAAAGSSYSPSPSSGTGGRIFVPSFAKVYTVRPVGYRGGNIFLNLKSNLGESRVIITFQKGTFSSLTQCVVTEVNLSQIKKFLPSTFIVSSPFISAPASAAHHPERVVSFRNYSFLLGMGVQFVKLDSVVRSHQFVAIRLYNKVFSPSDLILVFDQAHQRFIVIPPHWVREAKGNILMHIFGGVQFAIFVPHQA